MTKLHGFSFWLSQTADPESMIINHSILENSVFSFGEDAFLLRVLDRHYSAKHQLPFFLC